MCIHFSSIRSYITQFNNALYVDRSLKTNMIELSLKAITILRETKSDRRGNIYLWTGKGMCEFSFI